MTKTPIRIFDPRLGQSQLFRLKRRHEVSTLAENIWALEAPQIDWRPYADIVDDVMEAGGERYVVFLPWGPRRDAQKDLFARSYPDHEECGNGTILVGRPAHSSRQVARQQLARIYSGEMGPGLWSLGSLQSGAALAELLNSGESFVDSPSFVAAALMPSLLASLSLDDGLDSFLVRLSPAMTASVDRLHERLRVALPHLLPPSGLPPARR